ncbi:alpha/beta fold hydrolase [Nocardioides jiangxiensis]|uniref:Alpha/beta fold hydrolase n=1 Tax=Nocardioides jiangxiensis TaxID=3064524 RepID=A0ABT9B360_9ACTN|nr:alpha/beta fold hydrolase [Nocardioides sp. WY-20]MDO7868815.1 alpha/beta fold hydrolase [Nocardioides sp. WY-20]
MPEIQFAPTPAGDLAYVRRGSGSPLLLVMGVAGHHRMWSEEFLDALAEEHDVVAFDNRGIGQSFRAEPGFTLDDLAADAVAVLDHLGWETAHLMGISMGGAIAQVVALTHPGRVRTLVLGCTWPDGDDAWAPGVTKLADAANAGDALSSARLMFEANVSPACAAVPGRFEAFCEDAAAVKVPGPVILMQMGAAIAHHASDRLTGLALPTLVVHGTVDDVIKVEAGQRIADLVPDAGLALLEGVGHMFFWEAPSRSAEVVLAHTSA